MTISRHNLEVRNPASHVEGSEKHILQVGYIFFFNPEDTQLYCVSREVQRFWLPRKEIGQICLAPRHYIFVADIAC